MVWFADHIVMHSLRTGFISIQLDCWTFQQKQKLAGTKKLKNKNETNYCIFTHHIAVRSCGR